MRPQGRRLVACYRPTGQDRVVGYRYAGDTDEDYAVMDLLGGRWLRVYHFAGGDDYDLREEQLTDLRTGTKITAVESDEDVRNDIVALPGALVSAGRAGVVAHFADGRTEVLDTAAAHALAPQRRAPVLEDRRGHAHGGRLAPGGRARAAAPARPPHRAVHAAAGARLVLIDGIMVTRQGGTTYACRKGRTRRVGAATDVAILADGRLAYTRRGFTGVLEIATGMRRELPSNGPIARDAWMFAAGDATGVRMWDDARRKPRLVAAGPAAEVAVAYGTGVVYWLDPAGTPQTRTLGA